MPETTEAEVKSPRVVSQQQIDANRSNAQKSTGPRTIEGKRNSRGNATKHGLRASFSVLPNEDPDRFELLCEDIHKSLNPRDAVECRLVNDMVTASWRLDRALSSETASLTKKVHQAPLVDDLNRHAEFERLRRALPSNPRTVAFELRNTVLGCEWMIRELSTLIQALDVRSFWYVSERDMVLNFLGLTTEDLFFDNMAFNIVKAFVAGGWSQTINGDLLRVQALIRTPAPAGMAVWEYRHRVDSLTDSIATTDPDASRAKLKELILPEIEKLRVRVKMLRPYETQMRLQAREREMVDTSREGELRLRYESMHRRDFHRAIRELERYRKAFSDIDFDQAEGTYGSPVHEDVFAPNEPVVTPPDRVESHPATPMVVPRLGNPEVKADLQESKKRLGICPVPFERLNELIDNSIPNLNGLLKWADELEAERNAKAKSDEMLM